MLLAIVVRSFIKYLAILLCMFLVFLKYRMFLDFPILGPGTMLIASGPKFCEERRIRCVRSSLYDPVDKEIVFQREQHYVINKLTRKICWYLRGSKTDVIIG